MQQPSETQAAWGDHLGKRQWTHIFTLTTAGLYGWKPDRLIKLFEDGFVRGVQRFTHQDCLFAAVVEVGGRGFEKRPHLHGLLYLPSPLDCAVLARIWVYNVIRDQIDPQVGIRLADAFRDSSPEEWAAVLTGLRWGIRRQISQVERQVIRPYDPTRGMRYYMGKEFRWREDVDPHTSKHLPPLVDAQDRRRAA